MTRRPMLIFGKFALMLLASGCTDRARDVELDRARAMGEPSTAALADVPVHGAHVSVHTRLHSFHVGGELLAIDDHHLFLWSRGHTIAIEREDVVELVLELYATPATVLGVWTGLGTVSTLSHGVVLVLSAPVWLAAGIASTAATASSNDRIVGPQHLDSLPQFARFPQGLPQAWVERHPIKSAY